MKKIKTKKLIQKALELHPFNFTVWASRKELHTTVERFSSGSIRVIRVTGSEDALRFNYDDEAVLSSITFISTGNKFEILSGDLEDAKS